MTHILDVSQLEPCEPLQQILQALPKPGEYLRVWHRMEPYPLYTILSQRGYAWLTRPGPHTPLEIFIWHSQDQAVAERVRAAANKI